MFRHVAVNNFLTVEQPVIIREFTTSPIQGLDRNLLLRLIGSLLQPKLNEPLQHRLISLGSQAVIVCRPHDGMSKGKTALRRYV